MEVSNEFIISEKLIKNQNYLSLSFANGFTYLSFTMLTFTESWFVIENLHFSNYLGYIMMAASIPRLLFMIFGGLYADRVNKGRILYTSLFFRVILIFILICLILCDKTNIIVFLVFVLLVGICDAFYWPASSAILPCIVSKENLTKANSVLQILNQGTMIVGPIIAGVLIEKKGIVFSFVFSAVWLILSIVLLSRLKYVDTDHVGNENKSSELIIETFNYIKDSKILIYLLVGTVFVNLAIVGPLFLGLPIYVKNVINGNSIDYSLFESILGIGTLVGAVIIGIINPNKHRGKVILLCLLFVAVFFGGLSISDNRITSILFIAGMGITLAGAQIPLISAIQSIVRKDILGRFMSFYNTASLGMVPISYVLTSMLLNFQIGIQQLMLMGSITLFIVVVSLFFSKELRSYN